MLYVGRMNSIEESAKTIFGEHAASYTTSAAHADEHVLERIVELARPQPHWTALDTATGTGHTALALAPHVASVIGFERIHARPGAMNEQQRQALHLVEVKGELYIDHWYILLAATAPL
jgi:protein-L-isoaspartate O-methyltransferase